MDSARLKKIGEQCCVLNVQDSISPVAVVASPEGVIAVYLGLELPPRTGSPAARKMASRAAKQIDQYLAGRRQHFDVPLLLDDLTEFQRTILTACRNIPYAQTRSYSRLAQEARVGASAARAVGGALARNPIPIIIPCHRVLRANGALGGFGGGLDWKRRLLGIEGIS